jgi:hydrogenase maturation protease
MLTIIGCGNPNRSDDGVGVVVAQRLKARLDRHPVREARVFDCGTAGIEVMFAARGSDALVIVDASRTGAPAGSVHRVPGDVLEREPEHAYSLHDFRWDNALYSGRKIYGDAFPKDVTVWLIEAASTEYGTTMCEAVETAANDVYDRVLAQIAEHAAKHASHAELPLVRVKRGVVQLPNEIIATHLSGCAAIVPMMEEERLCLVPVDDRAGGLLLKVRNARGDRAVDVSEVLRANAWDAEAEYECQATWEPRLGGLSLARVTPANSHAHEESKG